ncbi:hypothetical protein BABINDRAFT_20290, partial [Babjeviella inositovora NRRL Y-12698]
LKNVRGYRNVNNPYVLNAVLDKLRLEDMYPPHTLQLFDVFPGNGMFTTMLHERLQPKQHVVMGKALGFKARWKEIGEKFGMKWDLVNKDPYDWESFTSTIDDEKVIVPDVASRDTIHPTFLISGNLTSTKKSEALVVQWMHCVANRNWLQRFGRVRMLLWVNELTALKLLAPVETNRRTRASIYRDQFTETKLAAISFPPVKYPTLGYWSEEELLAYDPIVMDRETDLIQSSVDPQNLCLLDIQPKNHNLDLDCFEYVTKQVPILKSSPMEAALGNLGPGAFEYFDKTMPAETMAKRPIDLTSDEWAKLSEVFGMWPFKPTYF